MGDNGKGRPTPQAPQNQPPPMPGMAIPSVTETTVYSLFAPTVYESRAGSGEKIHVLEVNLLNGKAIRLEFEPKFAESVGHKLAAPTVDTATAADLPPGVRN